MLRYTAGCVDDLPCVHAQPSPCFPMNGRRGAIHFDNIARVGTQRFTAVQTSAIFATSGSARTRPSSKRSWASRTDATAAKIDCTDRSLQPYTLLTLALLWQANSINGSASPHESPVSSITFWILAPAKAPQSVHSLLSYSICSASSSVACSVRSDEVSILESSYAASRTRIVQVPTASSEDCLSRTVAAHNIALHVNATMLARKDPT